MFIRIVVAHTEDTPLRKNSRGSFSLVPTVIGGSTKLSAEPLLLNTTTTDGGGGGGDYEFKEPVNACGCVRETVKWRIAIPFTLLFLIFEGAFIGTKGKISILIAFATICLVVACVGCNLLCCPCCQPAKGADE